MAHTKRIPSSFAALTVEVKAGQREYLLIPDGDFRASDGSGRPEGVPAWRLTPAAAADVLRRAQSRTAKMVVDYEHQTLNKTENGQPAPAAGRIDRASLRYEPGVGILGVIEWTPRAAEMIAAGEYAYLSPVFLWHPETGEVLALHSVALTNDPGLDLPSVAALTALTDFSTEEEPQMNLLQKLLASLGLADNTSEEAALTAVAALKAKATEVDGLQTKVATLTAQATKNPDPSKYVSVETMAELQGQVAALTAAAAGDKAAKMVEDAITAGKLLPAQKDWALDLGKTNPAALTAYIEKTPAIAALTGTQTKGTDPAGSGGKGALSESEIAVCKAMGLSHEDFLKSKGE